MLILKEKPGFYVAILRFKEKICEDKFFLLRKIEIN